MITDICDCEFCKYERISSKDYPCNDCCNSLGNILHFEPKEELKEEKEMKMFNKQDRLVDNLKVNSGEPKEGLTEKEMKVLPNQSTVVNGFNINSNGVCMFIEPVDNVNHPIHYKSGKFEVIDIIKEFGKDYSGENAFDFGNVVKYVLRARNKNGVEDLEKAKWYLDRLIDNWEE